MHDLVIRNGSIVDGTGVPAFEGDVAIDDGRIASVGTRASPGRVEIDATGMIVAPGWVDIHTHYDGQVTWDPHLTPSGAHGVTTVVMGNCSVGFAPVRPDRHDWLIGIMEGVEDIPGSALSEGIDWQWESFPEYLDAIARKPHALDIAAQIPHAAVRGYVMGDRAVAETATTAELAQMAAIVEEAMRTGALGFSTSRTFLHKTADGGDVPGSNAAADELRELGRAMARGGGGVLQLVSDFHAPEAEFAWMSELSRETGLPIHFSLVQHHKYSTHWRKLLALTREANEGGANISALVANRPIGVIVSLESKFHPFSAHPAYLEIAAKPLAERVAAMRDPDFRRNLLAEKSTSADRMWKPLTERFETLFRLGDPPNYEPPADRSVAALAAAKGRDPAALAYDMLLERAGQELLYFPYFNYADRDFTAISEMMAHPDSLSSLADGGAHCGFICDASMPTYLLTHWVQGRTRGPRLSLEEAVRMQTSRTASAYGLNDRGVLAPGYKADLNIIDLDRLRLLPPRWAHDLPAGGRRLLQDVEGYAATIVAGAVTWRGGIPTGALPGALVRGRRGL